MYCRLGFVFCIVQLVINAFFSRKVLVWKKKREKKISHFLNFRKDCLSEKGIWLNYLNSLSQKSCVQHKAKQSLRSNFKKETFVVKIWRQKWQNGYSYPLISKIFLSSGGGNCCKSGWNQTVAALSDSGHNFPHFFQLQHNVQRAAAAKYAPVTQKGNYSILSRQHWQN